MSHKIYDIPKLGRMLLNRKVQAEGGENRSLAIREYYKSHYGIDADLYSYGCFSSTLNNGGKAIRVGRYCSIAQQVRYFGANHPLGAFSTSPFFYNKSFGFDAIDVDRAILQIKNDVWIGFGSTITLGCSFIGNGAVIGAGSLVTKDVPAYSIVAGNPATIIRMRFSPDTIDSLEESHWWEYTPEELHQWIHYRDQPEVFAKAVSSFNCSS